LLYHKYPKLSLLILANTAENKQNEDDALSVYLHEDPQKSVLDVKRVDGY